MKTENSLLGKHPMYIIVCIQCCDIVEEGFLIGSWTKEKAQREANKYSTCPCCNHQMRFEVKGVLMEMPDKK